MVLYFESLPACPTSVCLDNTKSLVGRIIVAQCLAAAEVKASSLMQRTADALPTCLGAFSEHLHLLIAFVDNMACSAEDDAEWRFCRDLRDGHVPALWPL